MTLPPYNPSSHCVKCGLHAEPGCETGDTKYHDGCNTYHCRTSQEHFCRECYRCGYIWQEAVTTP
jgi:hypothetical protein